MAKSKEPKPITEKFGFVGGNLLQEILNKQPDAVTEEETDILRARRSYLTPEQIKNFGLEKSKKASAPEGEESDEQIRKTELSKMKDKDLKQLAKELKINVKKMKKKDIVTAILEAETSEEESEEN